MFGKFDNNNKKNEYIINLDKVAMNYVLSYIYDMKIYKNDAIQTKWQNYRETS